MLSITGVILCKGYLNRVETVLICVHVYKFLIHYVFKSNQHILFVTKVLDLNQLCNSYNIGTSD